MSQCTICVSQLQFRIPGIPLPYSLAFPGRISQLSNGTMKILRLPIILPGFFASARPRYPILSLLFVSHWPGRHSNQPMPGLGSTSCPIPGLFYKEIIGSPKFPQNPCTYALFSDPGRTSSPDLLGEFVLLPR
jgi:hypothetical protein